MSKHARRRPAQGRKPVNMTPGPPNGYDPIAAAQLQQAQERMQREAQQAAQQAAAQALLEQIQAKALVLQAELESLHEENARLVGDLAKKDLGIGIFDMFEARINMLIESIASAIGPQGVLWSVQVNLAFEKKMNEALNAVTEQSTKAQLALGGLLTPAQIRQLARETRTFGGR